MGRKTVLSAVATLVGTVLAVVPAQGAEAPAPGPSDLAGATTAGAPGVAEGAEERYVAFGDSFVSGPGIKPQRPGPCERSEHNFPSLVAGELGAAEFVDASCGGARTEHLVEEQVRGAGTNPPQLDSLSADTTLVTFGTLGGNDMGLVDLAAKCVLGVCGPGEAGDAEALTGIETARTNMEAGIRAAQEASPAAEIFVIGYGTYLPEGGCTGLPGMTPAEADYLQGMIDRLSDMLEEVAGQEGVEFVDMREIPGIADHTACAAPDKQWIRALDAYDDGAMFHPSACGMDANAQQVLNAIRTKRGEQPVAFDGSCVSAGPGEPTEPEGPTVKERKQALKKALASTKLKVTCRAGKVRAKVKGGKKQVVRVEFRIGKRKLKVDRSAPFAMAKKAKKLAKHSGKVKAVIRVRDAELRREKVRKSKRPACL